MTPLAKSVRRSLGEQVHIVYLDDSQQQIGKSGFQVIAAIMVEDKCFDALEQHLAFTFYGSLGDDIAAGVEELHASDLWAQSKHFKNVARSQAVKIFSSAIDAIEQFNIPIVYSAVDLHRLSKTIYATASPVDMAFRGCVRLAEEWFQSKNPDGLGLLISDESSNPHIKNAMLNAFYLFRNRVKSSPAGRGILKHIHDDMYFGDSKYSIGIQMADLCALLIGRHLAGFSDSEELYQRLSARIFKKTIEPNESGNLDGAEESQWPKE